LPNFRKRAYLLANNNFYQKLGTQNNIMGEITVKTFSFESDGNQQIQLFTKFVADKIATV